MFKAIHLTVTLRPSESLQMKCTILSENFFNQSNQPFRLQLRCRIGLKYLFWELYTHEIWLYFERKKGWYAICTDPTGLTAVTDGQVLDDVCVLDGDGEYDDAGGDAKGVGQVLGQIGALWPAMNFSNQVLSPKGLNDILCWDKIVEWISSSPKKYVKAPFTCKKC